MEGLLQFLEIGEEYLGEASMLKGILTKVCEGYFKTIHRVQMENMVAIMEAEKWEKCPPPKYFNLNDIRDLRNINIPPAPPLPSTGSKLALMEVNGNPFAKVFALYRRYQSTQ